MKSNFKRRKNDHYPTIDKRAVDAILHHFASKLLVSRWKSKRIVDICSPNGSAIVDYLVSRKFTAFGVGDAFKPKLNADWIITNTPYKRSQVDKIINCQIERVRRGEVEGAAFLLRTAFDHAKVREEMFDHPNYYGQIKICARLWWSKSRKKPPFHNFVWHIWANGNHPIKHVLYYYPPFDPQYQAKPAKKKKRGKRVSNKKKK